MSTFRRLLLRHRPHAAALVAAALCMAVAAAVPGAVVVLLQQILDEVLIRRDSRALAWIPPAAFGLYLSKGAATVGTTWLVRGTGARIVADLRRELFAALLLQEMAWHRGAPTAERTTRVTRDVDEVAELTVGLAGLVEKPLSILVLLAAALWMDWRLTVASLVVLPLIGVAIDRFAAGMRRVAREALATQGELASAAHAPLEAVAVVQGAGAEADAVAAFDAVSRRHESLQLRAHLAGALPGPVIEAVAALGVAVVIGYGGRRVFAGELEPGELLAFLVALGLMNLPMKGLSQVGAHVQRAVVAGERIYAVLDRVPAVRQPVPARPVPAEPYLAFEGVSVDLGDGDVLQGVDLRVDPGEIVALTGPSGGGKTTLLRLGPRLRDPDGGRVVLGGEDLRQLDLAGLRRAVMLAPQEPVLFDATVHENVALGRPEATREAVVQACRDAGADAFVRALPQGYDTRLGEHGTRLSGGQRQRLGLARALLADPAVLLLDEPTSALDAESEAEVLRGIARLRAGRATLLVAHRASTLAVADRLLVLADGRVRPEGARHAG